MNPPNEHLKEVVNKESELKKIIVEHVGSKINPDNDEVTVENVIEVMIEEFPEVVLALAEENFFRGYAQGLSDQASLAGLEDDKAH